MATNIQEEADSLKEKSELDKKSDKNASPEKIQQSVSSLQKKTQGILADLDKVSNMEYELKEKGADVPSEDELNQIKSKINKSIAQANDYVSSYK